MGGSRITITISNLKDKGDTVHQVAARLPPVNGPPCRPPWYPTTAGSPLPFPFLAADISLDIPLVGASIPLLPYPIWLKTVSFLQLNCTDGRGGGRRAGARSGSAQWGRHVSPWHCHVSQQCSLSQKPGISAPMYHTTPKNLAPMYQSTHRT